jgi:hypothetical protein
MYLYVQTGDKIKVVSRVNAEWVNGEFGGAKGIFPIGFVDGVPDDLPEAKKEVEEVEVRDCGCLVEY